MLMIDFSSLLRHSVEMTGRFIKTYNAPRHFYAFHFPLKTHDRASLYHIVMFEISGSEKRKDKPHDKRVNQ